MYNRVMNAAKHILVVDDDSDIVALVCTLLEKEGFAVDSCNNGPDALRAVENDSYNLVILDIMMPGMDGYETCRFIRSSLDVPIIFLSAKDEEIDQVVGLEMGADDYIVKPFRAHEFIARVKARLRRPASRDLTRAASVLESGSGIEIDAVTHTASLFGQRLKLTPKKFDILALLVKREGKAVAPKQIYETIWHSEFDISAGNSIMVHIRHLREKLAKIDSTREFIVNEWGVGYKIPGRAPRKH